LQQKSKPRNARREIFAVACAEIPRALRLCRKFGSRARQEKAQNRDKIGAIKRVKTTTLSINYTLAGAPGLEPGNGGIKIQVIRLICQSVFRKSAKIRPQSNQEVSGHFGMRNAYRIACHAAPRADNAEMKLMLADGDLREHFEAFLNAYNFAERLKALNGLRPYAHICKVWADAVP
jgi:hypothetical protein